MKDMYSSRADQCQTSRDRVGIRQMWTEPHCTESDGFGGVTWENYCHVRGWGHHHHHHQQQNYPQQLWLPKQINKPWTIKDDIRTWTSKVWRMKINRLWRGKEAIKWANNLSAKPSTQLDYNPGNLFVSKYICVSNQTKSKVSNENKAAASGWPASTGRCEPSDSDSD